MKNTQNRYVARASVIAVQGALAALTVIPTAYAADASDEVRQLTQPTKQVEIGVGDVSKKSAKFGEYNGLNKSGGYAIGNFDLSGGGTYDSGNATRWRVTGTNLGLDTRNLRLDFGEQGLFRATLGYDELVRNYRDDYKMLWNGGGTTSLTLPAGYPAAATRVGSTTSAANALANWNNIQAPNAVSGTAGGGPGYVIPALMHNFDLGTKRTTYDFGFANLLGPDWALTASVRHQLKDGTKLTGVNMNRFSGPSSLLPEPINSSTDQLEGALRYAGERSHFSVGYYGSFYKNDVNVWTIDYAGGASTTPVPGNVARMSGMPDNQMHQLNLAGGYDISRTTRLVASGSYSRMTQNESFLATPAGATWVVPEGSANAKVLNKQFLAKLTSRPITKLSLNASYKYDDRENRTPILNFLVTPDLTSASTQYTNEPNNRRQQQLNLDADYTLGRGQALKAGWEWQEIRRSAAGSPEETPFRAEKNRENTLRAEYRNTLAEMLTGRVSYARSHRRATEYEEGDPRPTSPPAPLPAADPLLPGFRQFFLADRNRDKIRGALNYQATDALSLQGALDYNKDRYPNSAYGLQEANSWVLALDGAYAASGTLSFNAYYTYEDMKTRKESLAISRGLTTTTLEAHAAGCAPFPVTAGNLPVDYWTDPCRRTSETVADHVHTLGLGFRSKGLLSNKFDLTGSLSYSLAITPITVTGGNYNSNGLATLNNIFVPAESFPDTTSAMTDLRLTGTYTIDKVSAVRLNYLYRRLSSSNWQWDAYSNSTLGVLALQGYIGPGMTSPNYNVHVVGVSYIYRFQ